MRILVIPEHFRYDQYILKPIITAMFQSLGRPRAKVDICYDPLMGNVHRATDWNRVAEAIDKNQMADLYLLCVDRDGREERRATLDYLERQAATVLAPRRLLLAENAWQEIEVWLLAGQTNLPSHWDWKSLRAEPNPKELFYQVYARQRGVAESLGGGRKFLADEAARHYGRIRQLCPEVADLERRIEEWATATGR